MAISRHVAKGETVYLQTMCCWSAGLEQASAWGAGSCGWRCRAQSRPLPCEATQGSLLTKSGLGGKSCEMLMQVLVSSVCNLLSV